MANFQGKMLRPAAAIGFVTLIGTAGASVAQAQQFPSLPGVTMDFSIGVLNGKAQEFVYDNGRTVSRLDWNTDNVAMANMGGSVRITDWLRLGYSASMNLSSSAEMDDYDFDVAGCPPSGGGHTECHSNSSTELRRAALVDAFLSARLLHAGGFSLFALAGDKHEYYRWQAIGGTANYGILPPGNGISYEQSWNAPYLGIGATYTTGPLTINGRVIGSVLAQGDDQDIHHLRSLLFTEEFGTSSMIGVDAGLAYRLSRQVSLTAQYRYQNWMTAKGPTTMTDLTTGASEHFSGDAAGGNNVTHAVSLGLKVDLQPNESVSLKDGGSYKDGPVSEAPRWSAWYVGMGGGWDWQRDTWTTTTLMTATAPIASSAEASLDGNGERAYLFGGRTWTAGRLVFGVEGEFGKSNASETQIGIPGTSSAALLAGAPDAVTVTRGWDGNVRGRLGFLVTPNLEIHGVGGVAFGEVTASASCVGGVTWCVQDHYESATEVLTGWTVGAGYEVALSERWFTRGDYRYTSLSDMDHRFFGNAPIDAVSAKIDPANHQLMFGLGYRF